MTAGLQGRVLVPEILDHLPPDDPRARGSRRDLVWINALMMQSRITSHILRRRVARPPLSILEIGSGDGAPMLSVARRFRREWKDVRLVMLDRADLISKERRDQFSQCGWQAEPVVADVFEWIERPDIGTFDVVCCNLFLHHFEGEALKRLLAAIGRIGTVFVATEPARNAVALRSCALLKLIGANDVTMHDAAASVRAGFAGSELSRLWPSTAPEPAERRIGPFTHAFGAGYLDAA